MPALLRPAVSALLLALLSTAAPAADQPPPKPPAERGADRLPPYLHGLALTDAQRQQIQTVLEQSRPKQPPKPAADATAWLDLLTAPAFNESQARTLIAQMRQDHEAQMLDRLRTDHAVFQLLTPQQQSQLRERGWPPRDEHRPPR
ncbi:Spy/CpxP family protein refolding chaperone [Chitinibacteraceae bacterium HSL-7]